MDALVPFFPLYIFLDLGEGRVTLEEAANKAENVSHRKV